MKHLPSFNNRPQTNIMTIPNQTSESPNAPDRVINLSPQSESTSHSTFDSFNSTGVRSDTIDQIPQQDLFSSDKPGPYSPDDRSQSLEKTAESIIRPAITVDQEEATITNKLLEQQLLLEKKALQGLARCVKGFTMQEVKRTYEPGPDNEPHLKSEVITRKTIAPNLDAILFTLANLAPERWQIKPSSNSSRSLNTSPSKNNFTEPRLTGNNSANNNNSNLSGNNNNDSAERPLDLSSLSDAALEELSHLPEWPAADPSEQSADYPSTTQVPSLDNNSKSCTLVESLTTNASSMRFETSITAKQYQRPTIDQATQQYHTTNPTHPEVHAKATIDPTETQPNKTQRSFTDCMLPRPSNFTLQNNVQFIQSSTPCPVPRSYSNEATASAQPHFCSEQYSSSRSFTSSPSNQRVQPHYHAIPKTTTPFRNLVHTTNTSTINQARTSIQPNAPFCSTPTAPTKESQTNRINHPKLHSARTSPSQSGVIRTILHARILSNPLSPHLLSRIGGLRKRYYQTLDHLRTASTRQISRLIYSVTRVCAGNSPKYPHRHRIVQLSTRNPL